MSAWLFALPSEVAAKPPASPQFVRADALEQVLQARLKELREKEEFDAKPRPERLVILLKRGVKQMGDEKLTGVGVIKEVFAWKALQENELGKSAKNTVALLPEALHGCFGGFGVRSKSELRERYKAARELVDALTDKHARIRQLSIDCLFVLYGETRGYKPDAPESERKRIQKKWAKEIRR
jgi:hypothetical protein